jgi:hypothetical protein
MPKRRNRPSKDIAELAEHFQRSWNHGQTVTFWLREHADELREFFRDHNWTWANLGEALTRAGITYRTGAPWTGENLRRNLVRALVTPKREIKRQREQAIACETSAVAPAAPLATATLVAAEAPPAVTEFQLIRRAVRKAQTLVQPGNPAVAAQLAPRRPYTEDEIRLIALGRSNEVDLQTER